CLAQVSRKLVHHPTGHSHRAHRITVVTGFRSTRAGEETRTLACSLRGRWHTGVAPRTTAASFALRGTHAPRVNRLRGGRYQVARLTHRRTARMRRASGSSVRSTTTHLPKRFRHSPSKKSLRM